MRSPKAAALVAAVLALAVSGCANIPTGGPVTVVDRAAAGGVTMPNLTVLGQPPIQGESPGDVVRGFLVAVADYSNNYQTARLYLTDSASARWRGVGAQIYDGGLSVSAPVHGVVVVTAPLVGTVDADGEYQPAAGGMATAKFTVVKRGGQWRISSLPAAPLLSLADFQLTYRAVKTYFLSDSAPVLVPDPIYLPVHLDNLPSALVSVLLAGPTDAWSGAMSTAVPAGTVLTGPVTINAGVADVPLSRQVARLTPARYRAMGAQLLWTLKQLGVSTVQISLSGAVGPGPAQLSVKDDLGYSPFVSTGFPPYALYGGQLVRLSGRGPVAVPGTRGLSAPAVSADGRYLAGVELSNNGEVLVEGPPGGPLRQVPIPLSTGVLSPSFAAGDVLWVVVDQRLGHQAIERVLPGHAPQEVDAPALENMGHITDLVVSRDGARVAAVVGGNLLVAPVTFGPDGPMIDRAVSLLPPDDVAQDGLSWQDADQLAVLVSVTQNPSGAQFAEPLLVSIDGSTLTPVDSAGLPTPTQLAAAPGAPLMLLSGDTIFQLGQAGWLPLLSHAAAAIYPGG